MQSQSFQANGARLQVHRTGPRRRSPERARPIVLIHGLSGSARWWKRNVPALAENHTVFIIELAGYGGAWRQQALGVQDAARLIVAWLEAEDLRDVTLIGHSMGGHIAMHVTALSGGRVRNLVLACASGLLRSNVVRVALNLPRAGLVGRRSFLPRILTDALRAGPRNLWHSTRDLLRDSVQEVLPGLRVRTLVVWGTRDALVPVELGRLIGAAIPGAIFHEFPEAGHVVMVDAPQDFNDLVLAFLNADPQR